MTKRPEAIEETKEEEKGGQTPTKMLICKQGRGDMGTGNKEKHLLLTKTKNRQTNNNNKKKPSTWFIFKPGVYQNLLPPIPPPPPL